MRRILCVFTLFLITLPIAAQKMVLTGFEYRQYDQTANLKGTSRVDPNSGKTAALLKIDTNINNLSFDGGSWGIVHSEQKTGQWWVYIPERSMRITIRHPRYQTVTFEYPQEIIAGRTYTMRLTFEGKDVTLLTPNVDGADLLIDEDSVGKSPKTMYLAYGVHSVKARKGNMIYDGTINVRKNDISEFSLKMFNEEELLGTVTVEVDGGADIYFEDKKVGVGTWTAKLKEGTYVVETRKQNCDNAQTTFIVIPKLKKTVDAYEPKPHTGTLKITSSPKNVQIWSDENYLTNESACLLPVGENEITYRKEGYRPITKTYQIKKDEEVSDNVRLKPITYIKKNTVYVGGAYTYEQMSGVSIVGGVTLFNIDLQASYTLGLGESDAVSWYTASENLYDETCTYKLNEFAVKAGYQLKLSKSLSLVPQVGYLAQILKSSGTRGDGAVCGCATIGAKLVIAPVQHLYIYLSPEYALPVQKSVPKEHILLVIPKRGNLCTTAW